MKGMEKKQPSLTETAASLIVKALKTINSLPLLRDMLKYLTFELKLPIWVKIIYMELNTEEKILAAARAVFTKKGYAAARMQEIAETADINKGLLHYYFRSKENLFRSVFDDAFAKFTSQINDIFEADLPFFETIEAFIDKYVDFLIENPYLPAFVLNELNTNPEGFVKDILNRREKPNPMKLMMQIQMELEAGNINPINPIHLALNVVSMCVFPFAARPLMQGLFQIENKDYLQFMTTRKQAITDFVINALRKK